MPFVDRPNFGGRQLDVGRPVAATEHAVNGVRRLRAGRDIQDQVPLLRAVLRGNLPDLDAQRRIDPVASDLLDPFSLSAQRDGREVGRSSWRYPYDDGAARDREGRQVDRGGLRAAVTRRQFTLEVEMIAFAERAAPAVSIDDFVVGPAEQLGCSWTDSPFAARSE